MKDSLQNIVDILAEPSAAFARLKSSRNGDWQSSFFVCSLLESRWLCFLLLNRLCTKQ